MFTVFALSAESLGSLSAISAKLPIENGCGLLVNPEGVLPSGIADLLVFQYLSRPV